MDAKFYQDSCTPRDWEVTVERWPHVFQEILPVVKAKMANFQSHALMSLMPPGGKYGEHGTLGSLQ